MASFTVASYNLASGSYPDTTLLKPPADGHSIDDPTWLITINIVIGAFGFLGNSIVILVFLLRGKKTFKNCTQMYILHQSTVDCLASFIFVFLRVFNDNSTLADGGEREIFLCTFWFSEYLLWSLFMVSTYNLVLVALERFLAIVKPVRHRNQMSRKKVLVTMAVAWLWAFAFQSYWPPVYELHGTDCYPVWRQGWLQPFFGVLTFLFEYFLPLLVMSAAYGTIIYKLNRKSDKRVQCTNRTNRTCRNSALAEVNGTPSFPPVSTISNLPPQRNTYQGNNYHDNNNNSSSSRSNSNTKSASRKTNIFSTAKRNVIKTLVTVFIVFALSWTPTEVTFLLYNLGFIDIDFSGPIYRLFSLLVLANMIANPLIYAGFYRDFQRSLKSVVRRCRHNRVDVQTLATDSHTLAV